MRIFVAGATVIVCESYRSLISADRIAGQFAGFPRCSCRTALVRIAGQPVSSLVAVSGRASAGHVEQLLAKLRRRSAHLLKRAREPIMQ